MINYIYRAYLVVPDAVRADANAFGKTLEPDANAGDTYTVELSPAGNTPATHYACSTALTQTMFDALGAEMDSGSTLGLSTLYWIFDNSVPKRGGLVAAKRSLDATTALEEHRTYLAEHQGTWLDFDTAMNHAITSTGILGLQRIEDENLI